MNLLRVLRKCALLSAVLFLFVIAGSVSFGQATTGQFLGEVTDPSGAVVRGATITVTDEAKGITFTGTADAAGNYTVLSVPPGVYTVEATAPGFATAKYNHVVLVIDQHAKLSFKLKVGDTSASVEVTDTPPLLQATTAEVGAVISDKVISDLPLNGRNFWDLTYLVPGVNQSSSTINSYGVSVGGQRAYANSIQLDGVESTTNRTQDVTVQPNPDTVDQFKVVTSAFNAEFGNASGGIIAIQTKSGTNAYHGVAYEFFRPNFTSARQTTPGSSALAPASVLKRHTYGGTIGGPIKKDRSFFFAAFEGMRYRNAFSDVTSTIPFGLFDIKANGDVDFSRLVDPCSGAVCTKNGSPSGPPAGFVDPIFDPQVAVDNYGWWAQQFPGNIIPSSRVSKAGMATMLNFFPKPNLPGIDNGWFQNYQAWGPVKDDGDKVDARFDQVITQKDRLYAVYHWQRDNIFDTDQFYNHTPVAGAGDADQANKEDWGVQSISATYDHIFSATLLNEFRFGFNRYLQNQYSLLNGTDYSTKFGYGNVAVPGYEATVGFPDIYMADGYLAGGSSYKPFHILDKNYQYGDSLTWSGVPNHQFKFGADFRPLNSHPEFSLFPTGWQYYGSFGNAVTSANAYWGYYYDAGGNWLVPNGYNWLGGSDVADLVLGLPLNVYMGLQLTDPHTHSWNFDIYAQDTYKLTPQLTLNYGIRYEYMNPWTERGNNMSNYDLASGNIVIAGRNRVPNGIIKPRKNDFSPRFGFAYSANTKTVLRGGIAIFYSPENDGREDFMTKNNPFNLQYAFTNWAFNVPPTSPQVWPYQIDAGSVRSTTINIPNAGYIKPQNLVNGTLETTYAVNPNLKTGSADSFNFAIQRELSRTWSLDVAYVGTVSHHLSYKVGDINAAPTQDKNAAGNTTYDVRITPYLGAIEYLTDAGSGNYNALQTKLSHSAKNSNLLFSYTYGHSFDNGPAPFDLGNNNSWPQNAYDLRSEYATSDSDIRHNIAISGEYYLPFGKGQTYGSNWNTATNAILGGWRFGGMLWMRTGTPVNVILGADPKSSLSGLRPNVTGNPNLSHGKRNVMEYFNKAAFSAPLITPGSAYAYGNAGRNLITGPGFISVDASLAKQFTIENLLKLEIRGEVFNGMNSVHYSNPDGNFQDATFGMITRAGDPRNAQFGAKFIF